MSKRLLTTYASGIAMIAAACAATSSWAQVAPGGGSQGAVVQGRNLLQLAPGTIFDPSSSQPLAADAGKRAHTALKIMVPPAKGGVTATPPAPGGMSPLAPPVSGYFYETPASLSCLYGLTAVAAGCNPNTVTANSPYGSKAIAIVDAYDYPNAATDLAKFATQFGLPAPTASNFAVVYATGTKPPDGTGTGWDVEAALDIEYAHGMAPKAFVYLVEAASNSDADLFAAVTKAGTLVNAAGGGEVSMSWGGGEYSGETSYDSVMTKANVVYFASSGDSAGTLYPCVSPNVVCVGGTGNSRNPTTGKFQGAVAWVDTGGGISAYEARPSYQGGISGIVGAKRGAPDVAAVADPNTGVWVYNAANGGWLIVGGTSVASPVVAGIANAAGHFAASTSAEQVKIYTALGSPGAGWVDVTSGACGYYDGFFALPGWDYCTGAGTPSGLSYKVVVK